MGMKVVDLGSRYKQKRVNNGEIMANRVCRKLNEELYVRSRVDRMNSTITDYRCY